MKELFHRELEIPPAFPLFILTECARVDDISAYNLCIKVVTKFVQSSMFLSCVIFEVKMPAHEFTREYAN